MDEFCHNPNYITFNQLTTVEKYCFNKVVFLNKKSLPQLVDFFKYKVYLAVKAYRYVSSHKIYTVLEEFPCGFCSSKLIEHYLKTYPTIYQFYLNYYGKPYDKNLIRKIDITALDAPSFNDFFVIENINDKDRMARFIANIMYKFKDKFYIYTCPDDLISSYLYQLFYDKIPSFDLIEKATDIEIYPQPKIIKIELNI